MLDCFHSCDGLVPVVAVSRAVRTVPVVSASIGPKACLLGPFLAGLLSSDSRGCNGFYPILDFSYPFGGPKGFERFDLCFWPQLDAIF